MSAESKQRMVKQLKHALTALWIILSSTIFFHIGSFASKGNRYHFDDCTPWRVPDGGSFFLIMLSIIMIVIVLVLLLRLGGRGKNLPLDNNRLDQLERLARLKASGAITEEEYQREKSKIWNKE